MSTLQQQRLIVEQLRREAAIRRINVSQAVEDIKVSPLLISRDNFVTNFLWLYRRFIIISNLHTP